MQLGDTYPSRLQSLLGEEYKVLNSGDGGEDVVTISARQGAFELRMANEIVFNAGVRKILLGDGSDNGFRTVAGDKVALTAALGRDVAVNPIFVDGKRYTLFYTNYVWRAPRQQNKLWLEREGCKDVVIIPTNALVTMSSAEVVPNAYCEIILMGANGGWQNEVENLVAVHRRMIARRGEGKPFIVIAPFWTGFEDAQVEALKMAFGKHVIDFRREAILRGLETEGIIATAQDNEELRKGHVPPSLLYKNRPDCHMNAKGYDFLARIVFERGRDLGYW